VAHVRELHKLTNSFQDFLAKMAGGDRIVIRYELPNFGDVFGCRRVKLEFRSFRHYRERLFRGATFDITFALAQILEETLAIDGLYAAAFHFVVATIERIPQFSQFREISGHRVFHKFVGRSAAGGC
jgi:hypothetical protein